MGPYRAYLNAEGAAQGIRLARENARGLVTESRLLFESRFYERAAGLAILALEEMGKISILRDILTASDNQSLRDGWQAYRRHEAKNWMTFLPLYAKDGARLEDLRPLIEEAEDHAKIERIKQQAFYSEKDSDGQWEDPRSSIDSEVAEGLLLAAEFACSTRGAFETAEELELWQEFIGPARKEGLEAMKSALIDCPREGKRRGLLDDLKLDGFEAFLT